MVQNTSSRRSQSADRSRFNMLEKLRKRSAASSNGAQASGAVKESSVAVETKDHSSSSVENNLEPKEEIKRMMANHSRGGKMPDNSQVLEMAMRQAELEESRPPRTVEPFSRADLLFVLKNQSERNAETYREAARRGPGSCMETVVIEVARKFSSEEINNMKRLPISKMMAPKSHKGNYLLCRTIYRPLYDRATGIVLGVEDPEGDAVSIHLFNYAMLIDASDEEREAVVPLGTTLIIREPTYLVKPPSDPKGISFPFVRVDTPSDVVFPDTDHPILHDVSWKSKLSISPRPSSGEEWRAMGLKSFKEKQWLSCAIAFGNCIKLGHEVQRSRLNRSEAYLRLGWNNSAFHDSKDALDSNTLTDDLKIKAVVRMIKAQYALRQYDAALATVEALPDDNTVIEWKNKTLRRVEEKATGEYDWNTLHRGTQKPLFSPDIADFAGPIEVKTGSDGSRGVFLTRDVKPGELLMFQKPICNWTPNDNVTQNLGIGLRQVILRAGAANDGRGTYLFFCKGLQGIWDDRNLYETILSLYGGRLVRSPKSYPPALLVNNPPLEHPLKPVVDIDIEYVQGVFDANGFSHSDKYDGKGLYALPSLLNHSCDPTAHRGFVGDANFIRASQNLKKGQEVTIAYISPTVPYDERQSRLAASWQFKCTCTLCEADSMDTVKARERRRELMKSLRSLTNVLSTPQSIVKESVQRVVDEAKKVHADVKKTYNASRLTAAGGVMHELAEAHRLYASLVDRLGLLVPDYSMRKVAAELWMDSLDCSGVKVLDRSLSGPLPKSTLKQHPFEVVRIPVEEHATVILMLLQLSHVFLTSREMNSRETSLKRAKRWMDATVYLGSLFNGGGKEVFKMKYYGELDALEGLSDLI